MPGALLDYHRRLFQWHCRNFFRFRRHLSAAEKDYLEVCFALTDAYQEISPGGYERFSYYTYSHRVEGEQVNSSRLAYGSIAHPEAALQAALPVLRERGLQPLESAACRFYGLGWDIQAEQFKVYWLCHDWAGLPADLADLVAGRNLAEQRSEGLISFTYTRGEQSERKVYLYPLDEGELPAGSAGQASMVTDARGVVPQYDVQESQLWSARLSAPGRRILRLYAELGEELDTIAYQDRSHYTLYFP